MTISADTWAIVLATAIGPIGAVSISLWRESRRSVRSGRLHVFRTLMATRRVPISNDHVNALNLVEVNFYKCQKVEAAWREYKNHLNSRGPEDDVWRESKEKLLAQMLSEMASILGFNIQAMDIFKGGYVPKGWEHNFSRQSAAMEFIYELSQGTKTLPLWIKGVTRSPEDSGSNKPRS